MTIIVTALVIFHCTAAMSAMRPRQQTNEQTNRWTSLMQHGE